MLNNYDLWLLQTKDEGVYPGPLSNISDVTVQINKYNFYNPQFTFPENGMHFNLRSVIIHYNSKIYSNLKTMIIGSKHIRTTASV